MSEPGPAWDSAADDLLVGSDPVWNSPARPSNERPSNKDDDLEEMSSSQDVRGLGYLEYCENIQEEGGAFYQIGSDLFVVNGWDPKKKISKPSSWFHVQRSTIGDTDVVVCQCPLSRPGEDCVHQQFIRENGEELFPLDPDFANREVEAVLFSRQELQEGTFTNHFSSPSPNARSLNGRVIVVYTGDDTGTGHWVCTKDSANQGCWHTSKCRDLLQKLQAVSYLPVSPPVWASLRTDPQFYERAPALESSPDTLCLSETSTCSCSEPRRRYNPALPHLSRLLMTNHCPLYKRFRAWKCPIELQTCSNPRCHHRHIGPDGRELGIFNYNNRRLFAHDLLNEYTSAYTSSETPFSAWVSVVSRRYELHSRRTEYPFVTPEVFRAVWFSYVKLQYLDGSMMCPRCGPSPENTIWDGVTLAFNRKHLLPSLEPPTVSQAESIERSTTRYMASQQLLPYRKVRRLVRCVITGPPLTIARINAKDEDEDENEEVDGGSRKKTRAERAVAKAQREMLERLNAIPGAVAGLSHACPALGALFDSQFGERAVVQGKVAPDVYRRLFIELTAEESVLQMANKSALDALRAFVTDPNHRNASALVEIPAIHEVLSHEKKPMLPFPVMLVQMCEWILNRGTMVLDSLIKGPEPPKMDEGQIEKPWMKVRLIGGY
ncbi:hypothetical protein K438DRAFT_1559650 [Mycena galopus ATCC 62051]|nr:hypothetical protein K438DRAFT_1559650 [Mycena galopus ATCC 62051]